MGLIVEEQNLLGFIMLLSQEAEEPGIEGAGLKWHLPVKH